MQFTIAFSCDSNRQISQQQRRFFASIEPKLPQKHESYNTNLQEGK